MHQIINVEGDHLINETKTFKRWFFLPWPAGLLNAPPLARAVPRWGVGSPSVREKLMYQGFQIVGLTRNFLPKLQPPQNHEIARNPVCDHTRLIWCAQPPKHLSRRVVSWKREQMLLKIKPEIKKSVAILAQGWHCNSSVFPSWRTLTEPLGRQPWEPRRARATKK